MTLVFFLKTISLLETPYVRLGICFEMILELVAVHCRRKVMQIVPRGHGHSVGAGGLQSQEVSPLRHRQGYVFIEYVRGLAGRSNYGVPVLCR